MKRHIQFSFFPSASSVSFEWHVVLPQVQDEKNKIQVFKTKNQLLI